MTQQDKVNIKGLLAAYCDQKGSQNKAANALEVSSATISKILSDKWDTIADEMWRTLSSRLGYRVDGWQIAPTTAYLELWGMLADAQQDAQVFAIVGDAGSGKTMTIRQYVEAHKGIYHLSCSEFWNRPIFLQTLMQSIGLSSQSASMGDMMATIVSHLKRQERPLIILDEADKLSDQVLYFFISLYNQLEDACGLILIATPHLATRIERGVRLQRRGFAEIYSRVGRKFISLPIPNDSDIAMICSSNGITERAEIRAVIQDSESDLRRVKRKVWAMLKAREQEAQG